MSGKLLPCPLYGCGEIVEYKPPGWPGACTIACAACACSVARYNRDESRKSWNTRVAVADGQLTRAIYNGCAWEPVRTCHIEWRGQVFETDSGIDYDGEYYCTACNDALPNWAETAWDDYQAARFEGEPPFRHCPNCGAKVAEE